MDHVPGRSTGSDEQDVGVRFLASQARALFMSRNQRWRGRTEEPWRCAERAALGAAGSYSLLELLRIERPRLAAANTPSNPPSAALRACSKPGEPLVGRTQADPGLCCQGAFEWQPSSRCRRDKPFPTEGVSSRPEGGYAWCVRSWDGVTLRPGDLTPPCQLKQRGGLHTLGVRAAE